MKKKLCLIAVTLCVTMACGVSLADVSVPFLDELFQAVENESGTGAYDALE